jgi:Protein tyrosine and serine/threonine kinase
VFYGVHHRKDGSHDIALKQLRDKNVIKQFWREAQTLKSLKHKNVLAFWGVHVSAEGESFLVTSYCSAGALLDALREGGVPAFPTPLVYDILWQCAKGMSYLERKAIIHAEYATLHPARYCSFSNSPSLFCCMTASVPAMFCSTGKNARRFGH